MNLVIVCFLGSASAVWGQGPAGEALADWPVWRGPQSNGIAAPNQTPPIEFGDESHVIWKQPIPGRGHSSPTIVGDKIFLTTSDSEAETQSVLCFSRSTGELLWQQEANRGELNPRVHPNNTHASPSIVTANGLLFAVFNNHGGAQICCYDFDGKLQWEKQGGLFAPQRYHFGYGASPLVYKSSVILSSESEKDGFIAAFNQQDGRELWRTKRLGATSYSTPVVIEIDGRDQLITSGGKNISAFDPSTGAPLWSVPGPWEVTCGTPVWEGNIIVVSGGFPTNRTVAIQVAGGTAKQIWENAHKCYEQSLLAHDGHVYALTDQGRAVCLRINDGTEMWNERLSSPVSASPVLANGHLYLADERGNHYVVAADPQQFNLVQKNKLGDVSFATPAILNGRIFTRVGVRSDGSVQEWLYCLGNE